MCELINKFIDLMKPFVINIENDYDNLSIKEKALNNLDDIIKRINGESINILSINYDEIEYYVDGYNSNKTEYDANKYVLESDIKEVKSLPQYKNSRKYLDSFFQFLIDNFNELDDEYKLLKKDYDKKQLINKYYDMVVNDKVLVNDVDEIKNVFDILGLTIDEKNAVLIYILKENTKKYNIDNANSNLDDSEQETVLSIINKYKKYKNKEYDELLDAVSDYVDISKDIKDIIDLKLIDKINIANIVLAKNVWLYRKIDFSFHNMNCEKCKSIAKQIEEMQELYDRVKNIKNQNEILRIIKGEEYEG